MIYYIFGAQVKNASINSLFVNEDNALAPQLRIADTKLGYYGIAEKYAQKYFDGNDSDGYKIACILFAFDREAMNELNTFAKKKFIELKDRYRPYMVKKSKKCRKGYDAIMTDSDIVSEHNFILPENISTKFKRQSIADHRG